MEASGTDGRLSRWPVARRHAPHDRPRASPIASSICAPTAPTAPWGWWSTNSSTPSPSPTSLKQMEFDVSDEGRSTSACRCIFGGPGRVGARFRSPHPRLRVGGPQCASPNDFAVTATVRCPALHRRRRRPRTGDSSRSATPDGRPGQARQRNAEQRLAPCRRRRRTRVRTRPRRQTGAAPSPRWESTPPLLSGEAGHA